MDILKTNTLKTHTDPHSVRGRPTLNDVEDFCNRVGFFLSGYVSGFTFRIKQNTFVKVYHEFVNSATASPF